MIVGEGITGLLEYGDTTHYRDWVLQDFLRYVPSRNLTIIRNLTVLHVFTATYATALASNKVWSLALNTYHPSIYPLMHASIYPLMHACIHPFIHLSMHIQASKVNQVASKGTKNISSFFAKAPK